MTKVVAIMSMSLDGDVWPISPVRQWAVIRTAPPRPTCVAFGRTAESRRRTA